VIFSAALISVNTACIDALFIVWKPYQRRFRESTHAPRTLNDDTASYRPSGSGVSVLDIAFIGFVQARTEKVVASCIVYSRIDAEVNTLREFRVA
jgi:hypothetical protein